jgi:hypothetical protein
MHRRKFIKGAAALAAFSAVGLSAVLPGPPVLYGDGRRDDTEALQAWFDGKRVVRPDGSEVGPMLHGGQYRITRTINPNKWRDNLSFRDNVLRLDRSAA